MRYKGMCEMKKDVKFEEAITQLETAVKALESGSISLDESISIYEEAIKLVKICHDKLEGAEARVKILTEGSDGTVYDRPFVDRDEN